MNYPKHFQKLIEALKLLPGVGSKSAERFAFQMIEWKNDRLQEFANIVSTIPLKLMHCENCGCLKGEEDCRLCQPVRGEFGIICIIASPREAFAIEATGEYKGLYHVLGGYLSPIEGIGPNDLKVQSLKDRIAKNNTKEVVIALDSTLEGDVTAFFIKKELENFPLKVTRLAYGLPMGSSLDYVDGSTLSKAFSGRGPL